MPTENKEQSELIELYFANDLVNFRKLIKSGANVNCLSNNGFSLISTVIASSSIRDNNNKKFFDELLLAGVSLTTIGIEEGLLSTAFYFHAPCYYIEKLLERGVDINEFGVKRGLYDDVDEYYVKKYGPPIFEAMDLHDPKKTKLLLSYNPDLELCNHENVPIINYLLDLHFLYKINEDKMKENLMLLIDAGADPNQKDSMGNQSIHKLSRFCKFSSKHPNIIQRILHKKRDKTLIYKELFDVLIQENTDIDSRNFEGHTALMIALKEGNLIAAEILIEKGANIALCDKQEQVTASKLMYRIDNRGR